MKAPDIPWAFSIFVLSIILWAALSGCSPKSRTMAEKPIEQVLKEHTGQLMALPGVVGTAQGLCGNSPCIKIYVAELTDELKKTIPSRLEGYEVDIEETGEFRALPKN